MAVPQQAQAVHTWPQDMGLAVQALGAGPALAVLGVATPETTDRRVARVLVRAALRQTLALHLGVSVAAVVLRSQPGQPVQVLAPDADLCVSVSHMPGLSVAVIGRNRAVGVDLMQIDHDLEAMPDWFCLARDYLGPAVALELQCSAPAQRPAAFAQAWTRLEACLKCLGLPLSEWHPALAQRLETCEVRALALPRNCRGTVAFHGDAPAA